MGAFDLVLACVAKCILPSHETGPKTAEATDLGAAIFSWEGHHLITLPKLNGTEASLCISKHSTTSLQLLWPPAAQTQGVFSPWCIEVQAWPEFIQPAEQQWLASKKMRLLWLKTVMKACTKLRPAVCSAHSNCCLEQSSDLFCFCFLNKTKQRIYRNQASSVTRNIFWYLSAFPLQMCSWAGSTHPLTVLQHPPTSRQGMAVLRVDENMEGTLTE